MNNLKKLFFLIFFTSTISFTGTSCLTTMTSVGKFKELTGEEYTYAKGKQFWLFWGIFPMGRTSVNTPGDGNCEVITRLKFGDILVSGLTAGLVTSYSIRVVAKK